MKKKIERESKKVKFSFLLGGRVDVNGTTYNLSCNNRKYIAINIIVTFFKYF